MLAALAAVALVVGTVGATASISQTDQQTLEQPREAVVEIQSIETAESMTE